MGNIQRTLELLTILCSIILMMVGCGQKSATTSIASPWIIESGTRLTGGDLVSPYVIKLNNGSYRLFYGGRIKTALSSDEGITWTKEKDDVGWGGGNCTLLQISSETYRMYYEISTGSDKNQIRSLHSAISSDEGYTWAAEGLVLSPEAVDNHFVSVPDVIGLSNGKIRLYYVSAGYYIRSATSDDGRNFTRDQSESNYILGGPAHSDFAVDPCLYYENGVYRLYYSTEWVSVNGNWNPKKIVSATSIDGLNFTKDNITIVEAGSGNSLTHIVDSAIIKLSNGKYRIFFGGETSPNQFDLFSATSEAF